MDDNKIIDLPTWPRAATCTMITSRKPPRWRKLASNTLGLGYAEINGWSKC